MLIGAPIIEGASDDNERVIGRRIGNSVGAIAPVTGGNDHDDVVQPEELYRRVQGIYGVALRDRGGQRQVDDPDVQGVLIVVDILQAGDNVGQAGVAIVI